MLIGYARVSTRNQVLDRQVDQLEKFGVEKIFKEKVSGIKTRTQLNELLDYARQGDTIVVTDLTRISRSTKDLIQLVEKIHKRNINLISLKESWIDTTSAQGKLIFTIIAGLSEFERNLISERTKEGLESARARGKLGGRPKVGKEQMENALILYDLKTLEVKDICKMCNISKSTLYNYVNERKKSL